MKSNDTFVGLENQCKVSQETQKGAQDQSMFFKVARHQYDIIKIAKNVTKSSQNFVSQALIIRGPKSEAHQKIFTRKVYEGARSCQFMVIRFLHKML